jgi:putative tryptophan/tyrosine transport system substrate-binding protein
MTRQNQSLKTLLKTTICSLLLTIPTTADVKPVVIAITQIIDHPALNKERKGILDALKKAGYEDGKTLKVIYEDAQGSITTAAQIATKFSALKPDMVVALSTPSAQSLMLPLYKASIPLVFGAITDPLGSRIVTNMKNRKEAVTGVSDAINMAPGLDLIKKLVPNVKTIGTVYNPGETNSTTAIAELTNAAKAAGLELITSPAGKTSEVKPATQRLGGQVQAILIINDNTAVAAMPTIVAAGEAMKIPIFAADEGSMEQGAAAGMVYDRSDLGRKEGEMAVDILNGKHPGTIPIAVDHTPVLMINTKSAKLHGLNIDPKDLATAIIVGDES